MYQVLCSRNSTNYILYVWKDGLVLSSVYRSRSQSLGLRK
uniref:Uncharacterized protein n=1 Tax=Populus trichocarpa TaxID=3694 RepID=A9PA57_POPTR|nr:unknown [Populus trichocarpa]